MTTETLFPEPEVHISWARKDREYRRRFPCPTEGVERRFYGWFQHWYGVAWTCLGCGDSWLDGELGERPFRRGWRAESIAKARASWHHSERTR